MQLKNAKAAKNIPIDPPYLYCGTSLFPAHDLQYAQQVLPSDILLIDFDSHGFRGDGLYVIEHLDEHHGRVDYRSTRRLTMTFSGLKMDETGMREWCPALLHEWNCRIAGHIKKVYRPV